jgi:hypothetical protein
MKKINYGFIYGKKTFFKVFSFCKRELINEAAIKTCDQKKTLSKNDKVF